MNVYNGINQKYTRDALDRMRRRDMLDGATNLSFEAYTYNNMDRIVGIDRYAAIDDAYSYYLNGELNKATYGSGVLNDMTFNLDRAGNRTSILDGGVNKDYVNDAMNQYTTGNGLAVVNGIEHHITSYRPDHVHVLQ